jgi:hypothetical protein
MEKTFEMKIDTVDADTVTLIRNPRYGIVNAVAESPDLTNIVIEYGTARDEELFPLDDGEYTITIRKK